MEGKTLSLSMYIDTHAHIYLEQFDEDLSDVLTRAKEGDVGRIYMPNIDSQSIESMLKVAEDYDFCIPMMGLHPCSVNSSYKEELALVEEWFEKRDFVAVGEIGTDLYWDKTYKDEQVEAFQIQSELAIRKGVPIVIHCRESLDLTIDLVAEINDSRLNGIFHCFNGSVEQGERIIDLGFALGIGGVSTFKNGGMDKVLPHLPLENMVLETDSPYLTPAPHRGRRNEPGYIPLIAERLAFLKELELSEVETMTTNNALNLFGDG